MRVAVASLMQESNTFVPFTTDVETFHAGYLRLGPSGFAEFGNARVEMTGFLATLARAGVEAVPLLAAHTHSGGPVTRAAFNQLLDELIARLIAAGPVDGVLLALHGAMVVEDEPDAEGEILDRVREALPPQTPVGVSLDLHGHLTPRMLSSGAFIVGYREYPHIDMFETGERVAELMIEVLRGRRPPPVMALAKRPMVVSPVTARTGVDPLAPIITEARRAEEQGHILHASFFPVQPWIDVPDLGFAVLICADTVEQAEGWAVALADRVWEARHAFEPELTSLDEAIRIGLTSAGTTVVGDAGDAPSSGSAADNVSVLQALLDAGAEHSGRLTYLTLCDAEAAQAAIAAGVGANPALQVGHKLTPRDGKPIEIRARVEAVSDGRFVMRDRGAEGSEANQGPTAVVAIGDLRLVLRSHPGFEWDTGIFTAFGLDLRRASLVFVKSPAHFRTSFGPFADRVLVADTPGPTTVNVRRIDYRKVGWRIFPHHLD